jgi:CheY-like chemotaxis protein
MTDNPPPLYTRKLRSEDELPALSIHRGTGPLDYAMPWVIEFRIIGTASVLQVQVQQVMTVGRFDHETNQKPDIDLEGYAGYHYGVSRNHAKLITRNSRVTVSDNKSANGTYINGERLEAGREYRLHNGDILAFGKMKLQVFFVVTPSSYEKHNQPFREITIPKIGKGQTLLIVEDDEQISQALSDILAVAGFNCITRSSVRDAMPALDEQLPALVLTAVFLSDHNASELIDYLRAKPDGDQVPVIVISSPVEHQIRQAEMVLPNAILSKPVGIDELLASVQQIMV